MVVDRDQPGEFRLVEFSGSMRTAVWDNAPVLKIEGDAFLEQLCKADDPVVVDDAREDPSCNRNIVERVDPRTLICVPLPLLDCPVGILATGTFGAEGCLPPTDDELDYLVGMAAQLGLAVARLRHAETLARTEQERERTARGLIRVQRLESIGTLAGGIAHDFNNLLTVVLSSVALLKRDYPSDDGAIAAIDYSARRGSELVRALLAMGRRQELSLMPLDLNQKLAELVGLVRRVVPENIRVELIEGVRLPLVEGDRTQLDQVFMNLCVNARDAMPRGGRLTLETEQVLVNGDFVHAHPWAHPGRYVLVTVTDTGEGMAPAVQDKIFEPFFSTKTEKEGAGLGLATTYGIVRQHGGMLHCYSEPGVGTTFKVYLPAQERLATTVGPKLEGAPPRSERNEQILVVEDDLNVLSAIVRILKDAGYLVTPAPNGTRACEIAASHPFDLALLDVVMPGMECADLASRLQGLQPTLKVLLSSGYGPGSSINDVVERTGLELLTKPYGPEELLCAIHRTLNGA